MSSYKHGRIAHPSNMSPTLRDGLSFVISRRLSPSFLDKFIYGFLNELHKEQLAYTTINTVRSEIPVFTLPENNSALGCQPTVSRFMKGFFRSKGPTPRYETP